MERNVGKLDRAVRFVAGIVLLIVGLGTLGGVVSIGTGGAVLPAVLLVVGIVLLATAAVGWCPPYSLFGIDTCDMPDRS